MVQWINLHWNNTSVIVCKYPLLQQNWVYPPSTSGSRRQAAKDRCITSFYIVTMCNYSIIKALKLDILG